MRAILVGSCLLALAGCSAHAARPATSPETPAQDSEKPRLLVVAIYDQVGSEALARLWPHLDPDGALHWLAARGVYVERGHYPYAGTFTAPGHATIHTGTAPAVSGVVSNRVWNYKTGGETASVDDGEHEVLGVEGVHAGPGLLATETMGDALKRQTKGAARVVSLSLKDRSAVIGGGARGDVVLWYESGLPGFTSSTYYPKPPAWVEAFQKRAPTDSLLRPWIAEDPKLLALAAGEDVAPGEGEYKGMGVAFPHDPTKSTAPYGALKLLPAMSEHLIELARQAVESEQLGADQVADLLAVSVSGTDYVGHVHGNASWEYLEHLRLADRAMGRLLRELSQRLPLAVVLTSDHGSAPMPEQGHAGSRVSPEELVGRLETVADATLGEGDWVHAYFPPFVYLTDAARKHAEHAKLQKALLDRLAEDPQFVAAYDVASLRDGKEPADAIERAARLNVHEKSNADLFVVPAKGVIIDPGVGGGSGTTHGTPYTYDSDVPVLFWRPGIKPARVREPVDMRRVAPTALRLLGLEPPQGAAEPSVPF